MTIACATVQARGSLQARRLAGLHRGARGPLEAHRLAGPHWLAGRHRGTRLSTRAATLLSEAMSAKPWHGYCWDWFWGTPKSFTTLCLYTPTRPATYS